ncbi:hypothetical protein Ahy_B02g061376 isoform D [Arachis hypogaea]|uniref:Uncharacterized protein n=1 Tax=Arachis hypogaea TaxID=3818 RepID=A0A445AKS3_ARAHY|nr:hypothetical protein Ahy_B02g061376 isoform D [Arachis hypogaea]
MTSSLLHRRCPLFRFTLICVIWSICRFPPRFCVYFVELPLCFAVLFPPFCRASAALQSSPSSLCSASVPLRGTTSAQPSLRRSSASFPPQLSPLFNHLR